MHRLLLALALGAAVSGCTKQQFAMPSNAPLQVPQGDPEPEVTEPVVAEVVPEAPQAAPDLVALDAAATHRYIKAGKAGEVVTRLRITTDAQTDKPRPPANIGLIVDTSASMKGEAIEQARQAALTMLDGLEEGDRFSVVSFGSTATVLVPSVEVSDETTAEIRAAIEGMEAVGTTALARGLAASFEQVRPHVRQDTVSRMVLLSDGVPNDPAPIRGLAQQAASQSISIAALGLGVDFDETLLADIASSSGGRFHFIEDTDQVAAMFRDEVLHIDRLVAVGSMMTLTGGPGVTITEVLGHPQFAAGSRSVSVRTRLPILHLRILKTGGD
ncbi:MAG: VWA domain-containing protein [Myxococcota bacterium]